MHSSYQHTNVFSTKPAPRAPPVCARSPRSPDSLGHMRSCVAVTLIGLDLATRRERWTLSLSPGQLRVRVRRVSRRPRREAHATREAADATRMPRMCVPCLLFSAATHLRPTRLTAHHVRACAGLRHARGPARARPAPRGPACARRAPALRGFTTPYRRAPARGGRALLPLSRGGARGAGARGRAGWGEAGLFAL